MLRINHVVVPDQAEILKLEGQVLGPWVEELRAYWVEELRHTCQSQAGSSNAFASISRPSRSWMRTGPSCWET